IGERLNDPESVKEMVKTICENYALPYFTLTPTFSVCSRHGYIAGEAPLCPTCANTCEVYSRIVGYLRPVEQWNNGKQEEYKLRLEIPAADLEV
ncbi:MAG TPA: anaerobic ribonucleoside-triphosphate reductase, partial [Candidatus Paceibacterota bacterium]|nr:anaerobic ribonucleoside-triphosphate reductase [Candidatus Paceibacterota bacterium]